MNNKKCPTLKILLIIIPLIASGCSNISTVLLERELKVDIEYAENLFIQKKYELALSEYERIEKRHPSSQISDKIIYNVGLLYLHPDNTKRDAAKGVNAFERLIMSYPKSRYVESARTFIFYSNENLELKTAVERLRDENERIKFEIEKFKETQIKLEKREKEIKK